MAGRRRVCLIPSLTLAFVLFYTLSFVKDAVFGPFDSRFRSLAEDTLLAACDSVREAMLSLLEAHERDSRIGSGPHILDYYGTKFERLQASLDNLHRKPPLRNKALEASGLQSVGRHHIADIHHVDLCGTLAGKRVTMIGGEHVYRLHVLFLQHRERAETKPFPCPYHEFCTHHHICLPRQYALDDTLPPRYIKSPTIQELVETESALVNYIVSDTLFSAPNESSSAYTLPFVDPTTGVRLRETYWLAAARKANVIVLGRGPISAPGPTYAGNWSFLEHLPDYVDSSRAAISSADQHPNDASMHQTAPRSRDILNAAVHLTVSRFLPDLFRLLQSIRREVRPSRRRRWIWPSCWYRLPGRGAARTALLHPPKFRGVIQRMFLRDRRPRSPAAQLLTLQLSALIAADVTNTAHLEDPWTLLFNAQVYLQNMVLRELLPRYGIVFLPIDVPLVGGGGDGRHGALDVGLEQTTAIGEAFLTGMEYVLRYLE